MVKAYWFRILVAGLVFAALALVWSKMQPKKYDAELDFKIDAQAMSNMVPENTGDLGSTDLLNFTRARSLDTQVEQLTSQGVAIEAAKKVSDSMEMPNAYEDTSSELYPENILRATSVIADAGSDVIHLHVRMTKADLAEAVATELFNAFNEQNDLMAKKVADVVITNLKTQADSARTQLDDIDSQTQKLRTKYQMPDVVNTVAAETNGLNLLKQQRDAAALEVSGNENLVKVLSDEVAKTQKTTSQGDTSAPNPVYQRLVDELVQAKADRANLAARYMSDRPEVVAADEKIKGIEDEIKNQKPMIPSASTNGPNPNYINLVGKLSDAKAALDAAKAKLATADSEVSEKEQYLATLPPIQQKLGDMARQQVTLEKVYLDTTAKLKMLEAAKSGRLSPTQQITPAMASPNPVSPKPLLNGMIGFVMGCLLGVLSALMTEGRRQPLRSLGQLNSLSLRPVYRLIPELREPFRGLQKAPPESFESLLANFMRSASRPYRIAVVGIGKDAGASTTAANLAIAGAKHSAQVLLVECDPKGSLTRMTGRELPTEGKVSEIAPMIHGMTMGTVLSQSGGISEQVLSNEKDLTVIDLEPTNKSAEYAFLGGSVDEVILLVRAGRARSVEFLQAQQALRDAGCPRVTVVFTRSSDLSVVVDSVEYEGEATTPKVLPVATSVYDEPEEAPVTKTEPEMKAPEVAPQPVAEPKPIAKPVAAAKVEPPVKREEAPAAPATPSKVDDFGSIQLAKPPSKEERPSDAPAEEPAAESEETPRARRSRIDTSSITS